MSAVGRGPDGGADRGVDRVGDPVRSARRHPPVSQARAQAALRAPGFAWLWLAALLGGGALLAWWAPTALLDWQPALAAAQPWRCWTAAFVHWSPLHLGANLLGVVVVGAFGRAAGVPARTALAWFAAWPLAHLALLSQPALAHYGGLSGVLHAGAAVAAVQLALAGSRRQRVIGCAVLAGLALKIGTEAPWGAPLRHPADWDIAIAPLAHATGAIAGAGSSLVAAALGRGSVRARPAQPTTADPEQR